MKKMKNLLLSALIVAPITASASGMGVYIPFTPSQSDTVSLGSSSTEYTRNFNSGAGFGVAFDSNIGKDKLYNYRLGLEYGSADFSDNPELTKSTFNVVNTFGFGVYRNSRVRLWVGPRLNIQFSKYAHSTNPNYGGGEFGIGIAAATGINVSLGRVVSLAADIDYRNAVVAGSHDYTSTYGTSSSSYSGVNSGVTARFYVLFKFGETFQPVSAQQQNQNAVDQSL